MGDLNAVAIAQAVHLSVLKRYDILQDGKMVLFDRTVPQGYTWDFLYIDDHVVLQIYRRAEEGKNLRDTEIIRGA